MNAGWAQQSNGSQSEGSASLRGNESHWVPPQTCPEGPKVSETRDEEIALPCCSCSGERPAELQ